MLRGDQAHPGRVGGGRAEAREAARLGGQAEGRHGVHALYTPQGRHDGRPPGLRRLGGDQPLQLELGGLLVPDVLYVMVHRGLGRGLPDLYLGDPGPPGGRPRAAPAPQGVPLVEDITPPEQELREPLAGALDVVAGVVEGAGQVPCRLDLGVGHGDDHDVVGGEQPGEEGGVAPVVLDPLVGGGALHLGHGAHHAVHAEGAQLAAQGEPRGAALVDGPRRLEGQHPLGYRARLGAEPPLDHLAGVEVERGGGDGPGVHVEPY